MLPHKHCSWPYGPQGYEDGQFEENLKKNSSEILKTYQVLKIL
jgi:hypothetical protein